MLFVEFSLYFFILIEVEDFCRAHYGYSYSEQMKWHHKYPECGGKYQSPIAIHSDRAVNVDMPAIEFIGYHNLLPGPLKLHNNGHSASLSIPFSLENENHPIPYIFGGKLSEEYEFVSLHFHWGDRNNRGSEHVYNGIKYPMEIHLIHQNKKYASMDEALKHHNGLAVMAFFFQLADYDNRNLDMIIDNFDRIKEFDMNIEMSSTFTLSSLLGNVNTDHFYMYKGSLTTPPCYETVSWIIFSNTLDISFDQIEKFRSLSSRSDGSIMVDNFRKLQPLRNRRIFVRKEKQRNFNLTSTNQTDFIYLKLDWIS